MAGRPSGSGGLPVFSAARADCPSNDPLKPAPATFGRAKRPEVVSLTKTDLANAGFAGFASLATLRDPHERHVIPQINGVYVVLYEGSDPPVFVDVSPAGWWKDRDLTLPEPDLRELWVPGATVVYIGSATKTKDTNLRKRIRKLVRYGAGSRIGHEGGRAIWQLAGSGALVVAWRPAGSAEEAIRDEHVLIEEFRRQYRVLPFGNRNSGRLT